MCLPLPAGLTPEARTPPSTAEVGPWVDAVLRVWDDPGAYAAATAAARAGAAAWHPAAVVPWWEAFLAALAGRP